jgi:hypothetical protein
MDRQVTLEDCLQATADDLRASLYLSMPAAVLAYHPGPAGAPSTVDVQPMVMDVRTDLDTGEPVFEAWSPIFAVPVLWPTFCGGTFAIQGFLQPNDQVVLEAWDLDPSSWLAQGRSRAAVQPIDLRRLGGNHWRANPVDLIGPAGAAPTSPGITIGQTNGTASITFGPGVLQLGKGAAQFVALSNLVAGELAKISKALSTLAAPSGGGPVTGNTYLQPGPVAATLAKAL